jgi:hypothetical protein
MLTAMSKALGLSSGLGAGETFIIPLNNTEDAIYQLAILVGTPAQNLTWY